MTLKQHKEAAKTAIIIAREEQNAGESRRQFRRGNLSFFFKGKKFEFRRKLQKFPRSPVQHVPGVAQEQDQDSGRHEPEPDDPAQLPSGQDTREARRPPDRRQDAHQSRKQHQQVPVAYVALRLLSVISFVSKYWKERLSSGALCHVEAGGRVPRSPVVIADNENEESNIGFRKDAVGGAARSMAKA